MKYSTLLPFLDQKDLEDLANKILNEEVKKINIIALYPFMRGESLENLVDKLIEKNNKKAIIGSLPFISKKKINDLYDAHKAGKLEGISEYVFMPFLDKEKIKELFDNLIKTAKENPDDLEDDEFDIEDEFDMEDEEDEK